MTDHPNCGTTDCCGTCPGACTPDTDPLATRTLDTDDMGDLLPVAAAAMWDHIAGSSPQYIAPWVDQSEQSRARFIGGLVIGLESMAFAADDR
jgi:hypothetical protein